ncbi:lactose-binding lectin l-2-like [Ylistrum balloti]|uniref:lactose-binding lectin l-2-like n=1 Tax=Ylistrum balloti TaxID=509963 RepID=UPI002905B0C3|nr:lactose-binding lectin l-2-like [Ylistrum balloti]
MNIIGLLFLLMSTFLISVSQQQALFTETQQQQLEDNQIEQILSQKLWSLVDEYATNVFNEAVVELQRNVRSELDQLSEKIGELGNEGVQIGKTLKNMTMDIGRLSCPDSTEGRYILFGEQCFMFRDESKTWTQAKDWCKTISAHFARPTTVAINNFMKRECEIRGSAYWVGAHDTEQEGTWEWDDGVPLGKDVWDWAPGEPNNYGSGQDCMGICHGSRNNWDDKKCTIEIGFICQTAAVMRL